MDGVMREVEEERAVLVGVDELFGFGREAVGEVFSGIMGFELRVVEIEVPARRAAGLGPADVEIEPLLFGPEVGSAEVPLADARRVIPHGFERLGKVVLLER